MRKPLIATTAACLLTLGMTGCGDKSADAQSAEKLEQLIQQMDSQLSAPATPMQGNKQLYTKGATVKGVDVPGDLSTQAAYIDQSLALLPLADEIVTTGNESQKSAANGIVATILSDESAYLIVVAEAGYQSTANEIGDLRHRIAMLDEIVTLNRQLSGDRAEEIDTYRTGKVDDNTSVQGINQLTQIAADAGKEAGAARAELAKITARIEALSDDVAEYEALELKLSNQALGAEGGVKYEKLDQATTASFEAQTAEANAESLKIDAQIQEGQAQLAEVKQSGSQAVVEALEEKIAQVQAEKRQIAGNLAALEADRKATIKTITQSFKRLDARIDVLGFDRMAKAQKNLERADQAVVAAKLGRSADAEQMAVNLLLARSLQQQSLAARSYAALLESLAASGSGVLGPELHGAMTARIKDMNDLAAATADTAGKLAKQIDDMGLAERVQNSADASTDEGNATIEQVKLYRELIKSAQ